MKITFINRMMGILIGGGENFDLNMARTLQKFGCGIEFLVGRRFCRTDLMIDEFPTTYIRTPYLRGISYWAEGLQNRPALSIGYRFRKMDSLIFELATFKKILIRDPKETDIFQVCNLPRLASWLEERLNTPTVVRWPGPPNPARQKWARKYSANIASGDSIKHIRRGGIQVEDIPYGVDSKRFIRLASLDRRIHRINQGFKDQHVVLLFVGRLLPIKRLPLLLQAFAAASRLNSDLRLLVVGTGPEKSTLFNTVRDLGLSDLVTFAGPQYGDSLVSLYGIADIFIIVSSYESFSSVTLEAMSCELPVIASKVGYLQELIEDNLNGLLLEDNCHYKIQNAILELASNVDLRKQMGINNRRKIIENYDWMVSGQKLLKIYQDIDNTRFCH